MKKTKIILPLSLASILLPLAGCTAPAQPKGYKVWNAYATENLISDWDYFDAEDEENTPYLNRDKTLRFNCMKNENEGTQLMISADKYISSFDFELPDVTGEAGTISKDNFTVAAAWYQDVAGSIEKASMDGFYPDALIPLNNYKFRKMNYIKEGRSQSLYINLTTTKDMKAGTYKGTGKLTLDGDVIDVPFEVTVYDAVLPDAVHNRTSYLIWYDQIANGERKNAGSDMNMAYYNFAVSKRISPDELPPDMVNNVDTFINNYVEKVVRNEKVTGYRLPIREYNFSYNSVKTLLQKMISKNLELINAGETDIDLFSKAYFYVDDEPTPDRYETVKLHDKMFFDVKKELAPQLDAYPALKESFTHIENIVTVEYNSALTATNTSGGVDTWCPQVQNFQTEEAREEYRNRQSSTDRDYGEHVWWYTCNNPVSPYPNYHLDASLISSRTLRYMEYKYDIEGFLFWSINYYSKYSRGFTGPRDIWYDANSWDGCMSDGMLVYPGLEFGIKGPITTLRLESILAGNEEYEYLWMIDQKVQEYNTIHSSTHDTNKLLAKYYDRLFTNVIANTDTEEFEKVRVELLALVELLNKDLDKGMNALLAK